MVSMMRSLVSLALLQCTAAYYLPNGYKNQKVVAAPACPESGERIDVKWLTCRASQVIEACKLVSNSTQLNSTQLYTPDATHHYRAQWTRDFYYIVQGASDVMNETHTKKAVNYTFEGQRSDGCMPDRVQADGVSVMAPGGYPHKKNYTGPDHAWDNGPFGALLLAATVEAWPDKAFFCALEPAVRRALDFVNRSADGLVFNEVARPNCTYGFTDSIAKTGNILFTSLLFIDASQRVGALARHYRCGNVKKYFAEAATVKTNIDKLKDPDGPLWLAASVNNSFPDVWGTAYLVSLGLSTHDRRMAAMTEFVQHKNKYFRGGQVRSLPANTYWNRCIWGACSEHGTYQNGAYWATPLPYFAEAFISTGHRDFITELVEEAIVEFKTRGIYEDVGFETTPISLGVLNYTASATNALRVAKILHRPAATAVAQLLGEAVPKLLEEVITLV